MTESARPSLNLIFDADDTLWESNIHFLEAYDAFFAAAQLAGLKAERDEVQAIVHRCELEIIKSHGYGRIPYVRALRNAAHALTELEELRRQLEQEVERIGHQLIHRRCEVRPGVEPTLRELRKRHTLMLFSKGQRDEQLAKLEYSGLASLFSRVEIPAEKDADAYRQLIAAAGLNPQQTFMVGNSPRSDINPAIRAGLRAVYIPHPQTWVLEEEPLEAGEPGVIILDSFPRLLELF